MVPGILSVRLNAEMANTRKLPLFFFLVSVSRVFIANGSELGSIAKHPDVSFTVVVNPFNGPGLDDLPDANYLREIPKLACHPNVKVMGYVHTSWAKRDIGLVCGDVSRYAQWPERSGNPDLRVEGVFVDETPNIYDADAEVYLTKLREHVKAMPGGSKNVVCTR